ncbi:methylated-DNA--[protein]-cysteine S-methyltransferase [Leadbettera azotonutricia]|uniref:Methylated-DNA--protein-cysteine methyltransferase n=1 Tax=Leadbettera azotonutricia (strain ATCC BAA-888 / DSM 13862 / ZAS-9) TaxID=545695 RepID=F5Y7T5_LEAAZ|nr:methylated-DNA--[protein]-cysteine S-methyltransferase [Leadbettera azotonutricia]AEF80620.1 methylated-DNA--[protein]-cysteine S-methyltransferase [Leadbettera azotonutricia ZAS-9]
MKSVWFYDSPVGTIGIAEENGALTHVCLNGNKHLESFENIETPLLKKAALQLTEYFNGSRSVFDVPMSPHGTDFQLAVWRSLQSIPIGATRSYQDIAIQIGNPKASRAIGMANKYNPILIIIPCHRIIGSNNNLTGYIGGLSAKKYLLDLEKKYV